MLGRFSRCGLVVATLVLAHGAGHRPGVGLAMAAHAHDDCDACHVAVMDDAVPMAWTSRHAAPFGAVAGLRTSADTRGGVEQVSMVCLGCHDGALASDASLGHALDGPSIGRDVTSSHPVAISYDAVARSQPDRFHVVPVGDVRLFGADRRLECTSCHDPHRRTHPNMLRIAPGAGALCLACHI